MQTQFLHLILDAQPSDPKPAPWGGEPAECWALTIRPVTWWSGSTIDYWPEAHEDLTTREGLLSALRNVAYRAIDAGMSPDEFGHEAGWFIPAEFRGPTHAYCMACRQALPYDKTGIGGWRGLIADISAHLPHAQD